MKTDLAGNFQWARAYGANNDSEEANSIVELASGELLVSGYSEGDVIVLRTDGAGNIVFSSDYNIAFDDIGGVAEQTNDGGYAVVGFSITNLFPVNMKTFVMKTNSAGAVQWTQQYDTGIGDLFGKGKETTDGGYILGSIVGTTTWSFHMIRTDPNGISGCDENSATAVQGTYTPPVTTPANQNYTGSSSSSISPTVSAITPTQTTTCLTCSPSASTLSTSSSSICAGESVTLTATGGGTYNWSTGGSGSSISVTPASATTYSVTVTSGGCDSIPPSVTVTVNSTPTAMISGTTTICTGDNTTLTASGGNAYNWSTGPSTPSITVSPSSNTTYLVTVTNTATGCTDTASVQVAVTAAPVAGITGTLSICEGDTSLLTASGTGTYSWSTGETATSINAFPTTDSSYSVTVTAGSCSDTASATIAVSPAPPVEIKGDTIVVCEGNPVTLTGLGGDSYTWSTGDTLASILVSPSVTTMYTVTATDNTTGCSADSSLTVTVLVDPLRLLLRLFLRCVPEIRCCS